jgi:hypothetical protein
MEMSLPYDVRGTTREVFFLMYLLAPTESTEDFCYSLILFFGRETKAYYSLSFHARGILFRTVLSAGRRVRVSKLFSRRSWLRAGATGVLVDARWPEGRLGIPSFVRQVSRQWIDGGLLPGGTMEEVIEARSRLPTRDRHAENERMRRLGPRRRTRLVPYLPPSAPGVDSNDGLCLVARMEDHACKVLALLPLRVGC